MTDLPDSGRFTPLLIGAWWPAKPTGPSAAVGYWSGQCAVKEREAEAADNLARQLAGQNRGATAEDMLTRLRIYRERLLDCAQSCRAKSEANGNVVLAVNHLRYELSGIANSGNGKIEEILKSNQVMPAKVAAIGEVVHECNRQAGGAAMSANNSIIEVTQKLLGKPRAEVESWMKSHGANLDVPPPRSAPLTPDEVRSMLRSSGDGGAGGGPVGESDMPTATGGVGGDGGDGGAGASENVGTSTTSRAEDGGKVDGTHGSPAHVGLAGDGATGRIDGGTVVGQGGMAGVPASAGIHRAGGIIGEGGRSQTTVVSKSGSSGVVAGSGQASSHGGGSSGRSGVAGGSGQEGISAAVGDAAPTSPTPPAAINPSAGGIAGGSPLASGVPSLGSSDAPAPSGVAGVGPSQAFASPLSGGMPGAAGAPNVPWSHGGAESGGLSQPSAPQVPPSPQVTPMAGGMLGNVARMAGSAQDFASQPPATGIAASQSAAPAPQVTPAVAPAPTPITSAPFSAAPAAPAGPLPGYGADLRQPAAAAPVAPAAPTAAPASSTPGNPTTPTSGGPTVASATERPVAGKPVAGGGQSGASVLGGTGAGATAGAAAGTAARRLAEHQDLQRKVDAVARQAPSLAWAAGLRDDEATTVLATDLAGGWIPPNVQLPPGVTVPNPAHRRPGTGVVDLLGSVIATATHQPNTYVAEAGPNDQLSGSGERARYGQRIEELGPTLITLAGTSARLPRIVQTVARAVARRSGVATNEVELFRQVVAATAERVLSSYPQHASQDVTDWMLLAAIDALIDGSEELARYHLAWHLAGAMSRHAG